jgi:hypothetical protein
MTRRCASRLFVAAEIVARATSNVVFTHDIAVHRCATHLPATDFLFTTMPHTLSPFMLRGIACAIALSVSSLCAAAGDSDGSSSSSNSDPDSVSSRSPSASSGDYATPQPPPPGKLRDNPSYVNVGTTISALHVRGGPAAPTGDTASTRPSAGPPTRSRGAPPPPPPPMPMKKAPSTAGTPQANGGVAPQPPVPPSPNVPNVGVGVATATPTPAAAAAAADDDRHALQNQVLEYKARHALLEATTQMKSQHGAALDGLRTEMDSRFTLTQRNIDRVADRAYAGVAAAMAMPNLTPREPGKIIVAAGGATYQGRSAFAAGGTYRSRCGAWLMHCAVAVTSRGDPAFRAHVGYEF